MTEILTVTPNPALDISTSVASVIPGPKLRCNAPEFDPGGGGVNVSRAISYLGGRSLALVALAGPTGDHLRQLLVRDDIELIPFMTDGLTRQSFAVHEITTARQFRFTMPGPVWWPAQTASFLETLKSAIAPGMHVVLSGSMPPGMVTDIAMQINRLAAAVGARLVLDISGEALLESVRGMEMPFEVLRMNDTETRQVAGHSFLSPAKLAGFGGRLIEKGVAKYVAMSMGAKGTVAVSADDAFFCEPPEVAPISAVGAGDSMVGAMVLSLSRNETFRQAIIHGTAAATAAVTTSATRLCDRQTTDGFMKGVQLTAL